MCDRGILEANPEYMKLDYCISIPVEIQDKLILGLEKLVGKKVRISNIKQGEHPRDRDEYNRNRIEFTAEPYVNFKDAIGSFSLTQLPGCCGILVSHNTYIYPIYQGLGINTFLQEIKEDIAKHNGFSTLMATVIDRNPIEMHILEKSGWAKVDSFKNTKTGNTVITYIKHLD